MRSRFSVMFKLIKVNLFLKRKGLLLPASRQQARSNQTSKHKQILFQPREEDTSQTTRLIQRGHTTRLGTMTKAKGATLSSDHRGFIPWARQLRYATREASHLLGLSALPVE
jgi:hypothetical protein